ncbi:MFS transporter [Jatrophihabitans sp. YIM 134969]
MTTRPTTAWPAALVNGLTFAVFLQWVGAGAVLPTLPVFLEQKGAGPALVGVAMSAFFVAGVLFQYPFGRLTDRVGERPVLVAGLLVYAVASLAFLLPVSPWACVGARFVQGVGSGAVTVAALAAIGRHVPGEVKGKAFARVYAGDIGGLAVGPLLGAIAGTDHLGTLFLVSAVASVLAAVAVAGIVPARRAPVAAAHAVGVVAERLLADPARKRLLLGLLLVAGIAGLTAGVYETCWTLLLDARGASTWAIGLSWTLFCVPFVVCTPLAGHLADRFDRARLTSVSLATTVVLVGVYPFIGSLAVVIGLGVLEAVGTAIAFPAAQALLADSVPTAAVGRAQGLFTASQTAATAVAAAAGGALFAVRPAAPFVATSVVCVLMLGTLAVMWRSGDVRTASPLDVSTGRGV